MKELKRYKCEVCGTIFANRADAMCCEKGHVKASRINRCEYNAIDNCGKYPKAIYITFDDHTVKKYKP